MPDLAPLASGLVLVIVLVLVVRSPGGHREVVWAGPAAVLVVAVGLVRPGQAADVVRDLAPTLVFLAAMFVVAALAEAAGLFHRGGALLGRAAGRGGGALLVAVALGAVAVTTVLSLDATAVLFTPAVVAAVRGRRDADRSLLATVLLANGASLLLPVANLTNLLALDQLDLSFPSFAARMALPTVVAAVVITVGSRLAPERDPIAADAERSRRLDVDSPPTSTGPPPTGVEPPPTDAWWVGLGIAALLVAFVVASVAGVEPAVVAGIGAAVLAVGALGRRLVSLGRLAAAADLPFLAFVAALAVVVAGPTEHGLGDLVADHLPRGTTLVDLLVVALVATVLANLVTNLPALLVLLPTLAHRPVGLLLAALIGTNVGPNLTVTGSLATLLWRRVVRAEGVEPPLRSHLRVALATTPVAVVGATIALWWSLHLLG